MAFLTKTFLLLWFAFLVQSSTAAAKKKWWETASFYQIYPRSYKDSDGDGIGDLKGITAQLPYLKEIGTTATWISPIFKSPMADFGYDIANFTEIEPMFGTMEDFEALMERAKAVGVKIILDFVPNHSSDECEWFIKSKAGDRVYKDYYVWHPGKVVDGVRQPPTNWISVFRGSMWTWVEERQAYYLHQFHAKQPEFNYRNPAVIEEMKEVLRFWLRKGVSGFRVDAMPFLFEIAPDADGNLPDEPRNEAVADTKHFDSLYHIYTRDQPENVDVLYKFRSLMDEMDAELGGDQRILLTEAYAPLDVVMQYYGNDTTEGAQLPFNFKLIEGITISSNAYQYAEIINRWLDHMPAGRTANWVLGNHDRSRVASRLGEDRQDMLNMLLFTLPGCSVTYNGEEIGMTDGFVSWKDTVDPLGLQTGEQHYKRVSRDPERTPFQWSDSHMAGFTDGNTTWLPIADNYKLVNVKRQRGIKMSHLNIYKQLHKLRAKKTMRNGDTEVKALSENVLAIKRSLHGSDTFIILLNLMDEVETVNLDAAFSGLGRKLQYVLVTDKSRRRKGDRTYAKAVLLMPKEAAVFRAVKCFNNLF